jgi:methionine aminotransferase
MRPTLTSKLPDVSTTIFTVMSQLATECGAINLSQGFPSFDPPVPGVPGLRQAIARKTQRTQHRTVDPDSEVTVCTGATEGLFSSIQAIVRPGDEVIVFDPAYDSYEPAVTMNQPLRWQAALRGMCLSPSAQMVMTSRSTGNNCAIT